MNRCRETPYKAQDLDCLAPERLTANHGTAAWYMEQDEHHTARNTASPAILRSTKKSKNQYAQVGSATGAPLLLRSILRPKRLDRPEERAKQQRGHNQTGDHLCPVAAGVGFRRWRLRSGSPLLRISVCSE